MKRRRRDQCVLSESRHVGRRLRRLWIRIAAGIAAVVVPFFGVLPVAAGTFDVVALSGDASPDGNGNLFTLTTPALNDAGQVAFLSFLTSTSQPEIDDEALYRGTTSGLTLIARKGATQLDGQPISTFDGSSPSINAAGTVSHGADRAVAPGKYVAFLGTGGALTSYLSVDSNSPPGINELESYTTPVINDAGSSAYRAAYNGKNPVAGVFSRASGGVTTLRLADGEYGSPLAFITTFQSLPTINEASQIGLTASVDDGIFTRKVVIRLDDTTVNELARDGSLTTNGVTMINNVLSNAVPINASGQVAFEATYTQTGVSLRQGVFLVNNGSRLQLTPNILPGATTSATNTRVTSLNDAGTVAFTSEFTDGGMDLSSGVYLADTSGTTLVALEDTELPDGGKFFRSFFTKSLSLNQSNQLAFLAELSNTANGAAAGRALFRYDANGGLEEILRTGDAFEGHSIASLNFVGDFYSADLHSSQQQAPDAGFSGLNNAGQLAFSFSLTNGASGIAIWTPGDEGLPGDYNSDGIVDAVDYTVWRNHFNQSFTLDNEKPDATTPGLVDQEDYLFWKQSYGNTASGSGGISVISTTEGSAPLTVPEPATILAAIVGALLLACSQSRRLRQR
jgi:hypothetical protein